LEVAVELIRTLRDRTGAGIMECKVALEASKGNVDQAADSLRLKGFADVAKRADRATNQGLIEAYIHTGGRVGALVELGCETDFVARTSEFKELAHDIAMQVAAMAPEYLDQTEIEEGDSRPVAQVSLLQQPFIKDNSSSVGDMVQELAAKLGENVRVLRFTRLALGE
jgi:elongation factor Ts